MTKYREYQPEIEFRTEAEQGRVVYDTSVPLFCAAMEMLTFDERNMFDALLGGADQVLLPYASFTPRALADAMGQAHCGNLKVIFESLCRKGFVIDNKRKGMFHVKRPPVRR